MSIWPQHLLVGSIGLCVAAAVATILLRAWRRQPLVSYRMVVAVLAMTLILPLGQLVAQKTGLMATLPFAGRFAALEPGVVDSRPQSDELANEDMPGTLQLIAFAPAPEDSEAALALKSEGEALLVELAVLENLVDEAQGLVSRAQNEELDAGAGFAGTLGAARDVLTSRSFVAGVALVYLAGLVLSIARVGRRLLRTRSLLRGAELVTDARILAIWDRVRAGSPLKARVDLRLSPEIGVPMCFGLGRPTVLLPAADDPSLSPDVLSCVLLHELVHLERRDSWVMLGQELARSIFWFHPVAWWLCRRIDVLRELSCDLLVVRRTGRRKRYASALVEYAEWMRAGLMASTHTTSSALLPWTSSNCQLARRIEMLVTLPSVRRGTRRATIFAATATFATLWGGQFALAAALSPAEAGEQDSDEIRITEILDELESAVVEVVVESECEFVECELVELSNVKVLELPVSIEAIALGEWNSVVEISPEVLAFVGPNGNARGVFRFGQDDDETPMLGVRVRPRDDDNGANILIEEVFGGSIAAGAGLEVNDVIIEINGNAATWEELNKAKKKLHGGDMQLDVRRDGERITIVIDLESDGTPHAKAHFFGRRHESKGEHSAPFGVFRSDDDNRFIWVDEDDEDGHSTWVEQDDSGNRHRVFVQRGRGHGADGDVRFEVRIDGHGNVHFGDDKVKAKHKIEFKHKSKNKAKHDLYFGDGHGDGEFRVRTLRLGGAPHELKLKLDKLHSGGKLHLKELIDSHLHGRHDSDDAADSDDHHFEWIFEHTPEGLHGKLRGLLKGLHSEQPLVFTRKLKQRLHEKLDSSGDWRHGSKDLYFSGKRGAVHELRLHDDSDDLHSHELESAIDRIRKQMRESKKALEHLRRELDSLRAEHGSSEPKSDDARRFKWRSHDQASLVPVPLTWPQSLLPIEPAPEPSAAAWFPTTVPLTELPEPSMIEPVHFALLPGLEPPTVAVPASPAR